MTPIRKTLAAPPWRSVSDIAAAVLLLHPAIPLHILCADHVILQGLFAYTHSSQCCNQNIGKDTGETAKR